VAKKGAQKGRIKLLIATRNPGKFREFEHFLFDLPLKLLSLADFPALEEVREPFSTFERNAAHKARAAFRVTGIMTLADDSGLEVDALDKAPGVRSARFAGEKASDADNNRKLLNLLGKTSAEKRTARFRCLLALAINEKKVKMVSGQARGLILFDPRGDKGFGYDPLFYYPPLNQSFAEMDPEEKLEVSHRGDALRKIRPLLRDIIDKAQKSRRGA